ncbi:MAG: hypothetical protein MK188_09905 [Gammaproteobacteria bacterium]|nr:hypothetical protein [Gammaproteobacteria bacterium]
MTKCKDKQSQRSRCKRLSGLILNLILLSFLSLFWQSNAVAAGGETPLKISYPFYPPAPKSQTQTEADTKSKGCMSCHTSTDRHTMHSNPGVILGCTDCHGGNAKIEWSGGDMYTSKSEPGYKKDSKSDKKNKDKKKKSDKKPYKKYTAEYQGAMDIAHVQPTLPKTWHYPSSANPPHAYTILNTESPEYVRFVNPGDYRIAEEACGACHLPIIKAAKRSLMSTGAMLWGGASYNNGILPYKNYILGEAYTREGTGASIEGPPMKNAAELTKAHGVLPSLAPLPAWETVRPGDIFRVFERGGRNISNLFPETGLPNALGQLQRLEEPGRPDIRQSNRGPGTGARISVPLINITKTRLNDPISWFLGTNDNPGDYRSSGCSGCHVVYANDRDPKHSGPYAKFGHLGITQTSDPTIPKGESGHPLKHEFTRAIPTSQCMICHMHQPNMFVNTYLGYTMWDYESDAPHMWPEEQKYPSHSETREINERNPEEAAIRGKWGDPDFLAKVSELNPKLRDTQFADYHGHGWNFRAVYKRDRDGNLLDAEGEKISDDDPEKFKKGVHMASIHADKGMHCSDCHFSQDSHGNGHIYGEVANAVEIDCVDCHGTADKYPTLTTSGPASPPGGNRLATLRNPDGKLRFEWIEGKLIQRSLLNPGMEWEVSLVKDSVNPEHPEYNDKASRAKTVSSDTEKQEWGTGIAYGNRAHQDEEMECYSCHTSWTTSCAGCHLPIEANWKTDRHHYEGGKSRNYATYNPQVARDQMFQLGRRGDINGGRITPVRSSSALVLSSTNANREKIYIQQPPIAASGFSSQAFAPHFPHTTRLTETKTCTDCHLSEENDNNAIMAQLLLQGTNFVNFVGYNAWVGGEKSISAVTVTEWEEPQAVIGSYLQKYAYPDWYEDHQKRKLKLKTEHSHKSARASCLQLRGEYLFVAEGKKGFRAYDVANVANKGYSLRIVTAPFSPMGQSTRVDTQNATCMALPTNQNIAPERNQGELMRVVNQEQPFHPIYSYAFVTDSSSGLVLVDVNTLADGEFRNNDLTAQLVWNEDGVLNGARHITIGGHYAYIIADAGLVILNLDSPLEPKLEKIIPLNDGRATALQFRYLFVTDADGLKVVDVTQGAEPKLLENNTITMANAQRIYVARTYAYVAAGEEGLVIVDVKNPTKMKLLQKYTADGKINDARDIVVGSTNASLFAYVADGVNGLKVLQLTSPDSQPKFYGYSPEPKPALIAWRKTKSPAIALSKGLDRDRAVDETGGQIAVFGRLGSRPLNKQEMQKLYQNAKGKIWTVSDEPNDKDRVDAK